jgi:hypothetical protein
MWLFLFVVSFVGCAGALPGDVVDIVPGADMEVVQAAWARTVINGVRGGVAITAELTVCYCSGDCSGCGSDG